MTIQIPKQLQNENFRFNKLKVKAKLPIELDWQNANNYTFDNLKLIAHLQKSGNYGVVAGFGKLRILDVDDKELSDYLLQYTNTFTIKTCGGLTHFYFLIDDIESKTVAKKYELRCEGQYVVGPNCYAIDEKKKHEGTYEVLKDIEIAVVTKEYIEELLEVSLTDKLIQAPIITTEFENVDKLFIEYNIFTNIKNDILALINNYTPEGTRSQIDEKIIVHLVLMGYSRYIKSIFELYPCGDKYRNHSAKDKYLQYSIKKARQYSGMINDTIPLLHKKIFDMPKNVIESKLEEILKEILTIEKPIHREPLLIDINKKTKIGLRVLKEEIKNIEVGIEKIDIEKDMISATDLLAMPAILHKWHINPIILDSMSTLLVGDPSSFKSGFALLCALNLLSEQKWMLSRFTIEDSSKPKILYYNLEMGQNISSLISYFKKGLGITDIHLQNLKIRNNFTDVKQELEFIKKHNFKIVIVDSLKRVMKGNENDSSVANEFFMSFIKPMKELGVSSLVIHHTRKPSEDKDKGPKITMHNIRGSTDIPAQYDTAWQLQKIGDDDENIDENYIPSSTVQIIKDFDVIATRTKDSRVLSNVNTFTFHVHVDNVTQTTNFAFMYYYKAKHKEQAKNKVIEYIRTHINAQRAEMINYFADTVKSVTIDKYLQELLSENKIISDGRGRYTLCQHILQVVTDPQTKLDGDKK